MRRILQLLAAVVGSFAMAGCSFNPIGENSFDCNRKENPSEFCRSFKALERSTDGPLPESRFDKEFRMSDHDRATGIAPSATTPTTQRSGTSGVLPHQRVVASGDTYAGMPVRQAPVVQRTWIKSFVDESDSLQEDIVAYREIAGPRWTGFDSASDQTRAPGAYPRRARPVQAVEPEPSRSTRQTHLAQPGVDSDGAARSAMSPAGSQSGDESALNVER